MLITLLWLHVVGRYKVAPSHQRNTTFIPLMPISSPAGVCEIWAPTVGQQYWVWLWLFCSLVSGLVKPPLHITASTISIR